MIARHLFVALTLLSLVPAVAWVNPSRGAEPNSPLAAHEIAVPATPASLPDSLPMADSLSAVPFTSDSLGVPPADSVWVGADSLGVPPADSVWVGADSLGVPPADSLWVGADSLGVPPTDLLPGASDSWLDVVAADSAGADTAAVILEPQVELGDETPPAGEPGFVQRLGLLVHPTRTDKFGLIAAWEAARADTARLRPLRPVRTRDPRRDHLFYRLYRRGVSRHFVREQLGLLPRFFDTSDSITAVCDAAADSLEDIGVASGVLFRFSRSGGLRYLPPTGRELSRQPIVQWQHDVNLDGEQVTRSLLRKGLEVTRGVREPYADYLVRTTWLQARRVWKAEIEKSMKAATVEGGRAGLVRVSLPFELPKAMKSIFGEGTPNLSVSGSERLTFGGRSQWFPYRPSYEYQRKPSKFPQLEMKQDLTIRLKGSIGDKLDVDVDQSSQAQTSLANRIRIHYKGYEDEIIRSVDLGNTSLRLPGTEYVSYGGAHTGLFGINAEAQLGDLTVNMIVSKEEGETGEKSSSIRSQEQTKTIHDYEYVKDRFFFLDDPMRAAYPGGDFIVKIREGSVILFLDDGDGDTQEEFATIPGAAVLNLEESAPDLEDPELVRTGPLYFEQLEYGTDYTVLIDDRQQTHPIVIFNRYLDERSTLGVVYYDEGRGRSVGGVVTGDGAEVADSLYVKMIRARYDLLRSNLSEGSWGPLNNLMLKNAYPLHQSLENWTEEGLPENSILEDGFELRIQYKGTIDGVEDPDEIAGTRIIRYLGIDYYEETGSGLAMGEDGQVDPVWIDFKNGYLFFPDLLPFAPDGDLRGRPGSGPWAELPAEYWNEGIYNARSCVRDRDLPGQDTTWVSRYYIEVDFRTPVSELRIDAWDIIEGSEVVTVGGRRLNRDSDYRIDYQTGVIRLFEEANIGEDEEIRVAYKHAGGFGSVSKTLLGAAVSYQPEDSDFAFSSSWIYQRTGSPDRRPRLGSEPTRTAVGEIAARYGRESMALTRLLDRLPFLNARQPSRISLEGGLGISFPNPNTRNDLYIDDFEGVADDINVQLHRLGWKAASVPAAAVGDDEAARSARRGEIWWYSPYHALREGDLNPTLDYQEANDYRSVLEMQLWPYDGPLDSQGTTFCPVEESWVGVSQGLSATNIDMTRARFLDIWVNDFVPWETFALDSTQRAGTMYVELGRISEDALWERREIDCATGRVIGAAIAPANRALDTEDANRDRELDLSDETNEDTGLDGVLASDPADSTFDDFVWEADAEARYETYEELCEVYRGVNGTESNGRLDTEDLDGDNWLSQENKYFQFRIDLADTNFVETDVRRDYAGEETNWTLDEDNGWRRIRIPLSDAYVDDKIGNPSWDEIKHVRIWFSDLTGWRRVQIAAIEIRSNQWVAEAIRDTSGTLVPPEELAAREEDFFPGVFNNKENADVYYAPFSEHRDRSRDNIREREQSLTLELRNFQPDHVGKIYMPFLRDQDYMRYAALRFWLNSTLPPDSDAEFFLRICKDATIDTTDYYEYRVPVPKLLDPQDTSGDWRDIEINLSDLSDLKALPGADSLTVSRVLPDGGRITMKGRPYLTKVRRISMGVVSLDDEPVRNGNVWIDELRLTDVHKEIDYAFRVQMRTQLADICHVDLSYKRVGADFVSISGGGFSQRLQQETHLAISTSSIPLERFLPRSLQLRMPFGYQYSRNRKVPKYRTNDDLLVGDDPTDRDVTEGVTRNFNLGLSRQKSRGGLLKYTLDCLTLNGSVRESHSNNPNGRDSLTTRTWTGTFSFPFEQLGVVSLYRGWRLRLLPTAFSIAMTRSEKEQIRYRRENGDLNRPFVLDDKRRIRSGGVTLTTGLRPIQAVNYNFKQARDLMLREKANWLGGVNVGRETSRSEDLGLTYQLRAVRGWIEPRLNWKGTFKGSFSQQGNTGTGGLERTNDFTNSRTTSVSMPLPIASLLTALSEVGNTLGGSDEGEDAASGEGDEEADADGEDRRGEGGEPGGGDRRPAPITRRRSGGGLSRLLSISRTMATYSINDRSTYNKVLGTPGLAYQLGFSMDADVEELGSSRESRGTGRNFGLDTDLKVLQTISVSCRVKDSDSEARSSGTVTGTRDRTLPELDIRWGDLSQKFGIKQYFRSFKASTRFSRQEKTTSLASETTKRTQTVNWQPLMDLSMTFRSGLVASARFDRNQSRNEDYSGVHRITERVTTRLSLSAKKSLNITREVTLPLTNRKERITTKLDVTLSFKLDSTRSETSTEGSAPQVTGDSRKYDVSLAGSYQFSRSVTGRVSIEYGENADNKNKTYTSRYMGVNLSAGFSF